MCFISIKVERKSLLTEHVTVILKILHVTLFTRYVDKSESQTFGRIVHGIPKY